MSATRVTQKRLREIAAHGDSEAASIAEELLRLRREDATRRADRERYVSHAVKNGWSNTSGRGGR